MADCGTASDTNDKSFGPRSVWLWGENDHKNGVSLVGKVLIYSSIRHLILASDQAIRVGHVHLCFSKKDSARLRRSDQTLCCCPRSVASGLSALL